MICIASILLVRLLFHHFLFPPSPPFYATFLPSRSFFSFRRLFPCGQYGVGYAYFGVCLNTAPLGCRRLFPCGQYGVGYAYFGVCLNTAPLGCR
ncbi:MAG: hypothetical protein KIG72_02570, partial [Bradymonadales bacterium]|nr:hypothetical protein [Bradymonadales bacterium]